MGVRIEEYDPRLASDGLLMGVHEAYLDKDLDFMPGDPPTPIEQHRALWQAPVGTHRKDRRWVALDADEVVGASHMATWVDHKNSGQLDVVVRRDRRRHGIGRRLLLACLGGLEEEGRSKLIIDAPRESPLNPALARLGLRKVLGETISRLTVSQINWDLMGEWIAVAAERAGDYDLLYLETPLPEEHLPRWCKITEAMNTAPLEDMDLGDETMTPDKWRSIESTLAGRGDLMRICIAVHQPSGEFAGMTALHGQTHQPDAAQQGDTVVDPAHRNQGLGRLVKAANVKRFLAEFPDVERIYTGNAGTNEPMLNINVAMGFRPAMLMSAWQGDIAAARSVLGVTS